MATMANRWRNGLEERGLDAADAVMW
jgi:hypothetical protein